MMFQVDLKLEGIPLSLVLQAIDRGHNGQKKILDIMNETQKEPRTTRKANGPLWEEINIPGNKHRHLIGHGGVNMKRLTAETGKQFSVHLRSLFCHFTKHQ